MQWSSADELEQAILARIERGTLRVPPYPSVALALHKLVAQDNYGLGEVLALVSTDPSLVADVLRCANAAFFGRGTVSSLQQAVARIGANQVTRLALVSGLSGMVRTVGPLAALRRQAWESSLASAALCQTLAPMRRLAGESAFVAGLLHDFGWLIGVAAAEEMLAHEAEAPPRGVEFWNTAVEASHTRVGLALATRWKLPDLLRDVIAQHHDAELSSVFAPFVELVALVDKVVALLSAHSTVTLEMLEQFPQLTWAERRALTQAIPQVPELVSAFDCEPQGAAPPSKLQHPPAALPAGFKPMDFPVQQLSPRRRGPFTMIGIAASSFIMRGRDALPEKQLVELEIALPKKRLRFWFKVEQCHGEQLAHRLECRPFALNSASLKEWQALCEMNPRELKAREAKTREMKTHE